jgi:spore maturation protein CgeB
VKVLVVQPGMDFSPADMARGWVKGLRQAGCEVVDFNFADRLAFYAGAHMKRGRRWVPAFDGEGSIRLAAKGIEHVCYEFWPDLVVIISGFYVPPDLYRLLRARGHRVALICSEEPYETDRELVRAELADIVILNDPTNLELFRAVNPNTTYLPHAYDPDVHRPGPPSADAASDFAFVGTGFPSRVEFFEQVDWTGIDVAIAGAWQNLAPESPLRKFVAHDITDCCPNDQAAVLYQSTKASANLYRKETTEGGTAEGAAMSPRELELAATGCFFLREPRDEGDRVLPMLPTFTGPADFADQLRWWLAHDSEREAATLAARVAIEPFTFISNARELLRLYEQKGT